MRIDKFLKVARIIKRRTVANTICENGRVHVNGRPAKPATQVAVGDIIEISFGTGSSRVRVLRLTDTVRKDEAAQLYEVLEGRQERLSVDE